MGKYDVALSHYTRALEIVRTTPNLILLVSLLNNKAGLHARLGEYKTAETLLKESLKITTDSNLMPQKLECLKQMSALYESTGKFQKALSYLNEYQTLNEMVFNDKVKNGIIKYESDYLTEKLEQKAEIYRLHNVELVEKNVIISEKQAELEVALTLLSEANATKDKLFAIIAHDLRGPVSGLQMALQIILTSNCPKADQDKMLIVLNEQTKNTFGLLENLLWWSQAQKEGFRLNIESLMLNPILDTIKSIYHTIAQTKGITMEFELDDNLCVMADKDALALVLRNLISNAIKYAPLNSAVKIKACLHGKSVEVSIIDQGSGINPNIITAIKKNNKLQSIPGTDSEIGMGLGLSLCYEFVKQMKGKLNLCNKETPGTCFCLELPIN
jgi:signal transduction histidine kinase